MKLKARLTKVLQVSLATLLATGVAFSTVPMYAREHVELEQHKVFEMVPEIFSPEFPDAYVEKEILSTKTYNNKNVVGAVSMTLYVQEKYDEVNGEKVCLSSRLLSKEEVDRIGKEKFNAKASVGSDTESNGTLKIVFTILENNDPNDYELIGNAVWGGSWGDGYDVPYLGDDFVGFTWGGDFDSYGEYASGDYTSPNFTMDLYEAKYRPNEGIVWGFADYIPGGGSRPNASADSIYSEINVYKNTLTGSGNTTAFVYQYTHTYEEMKPSISIDQDGGGFSLSPASDSWSVVTFVNHIPY